MRHHYLPLALAILCTACSETTDIDRPTEDVTFIIDNLNVDYLTRASLSSESMTDLWVYEGTTILAHKVSTDTDFDSPAIPLTYGQHTLTFVASKATGQSFSDTWQCTKVAQTFGKVLSVNVNGSSSARRIEMPRRSSQIVFTIEDAIPTTISKMHLKADSNLALTDDLTGDDAIVYEATVDISAQQGTKNYKPTVNVLTTSPSDEEDCDLMIEFLDAADNVVYHYERTVPVKANRVTNLHGSYFAGNVNALTINTDWLDELSVDL